MIWFTAAFHFLFFKLLLLLCGKQTGQGVQGAKMGNGAWSGGQTASGEVVLVGMGRWQYTGEEETDRGGILKADLADLCGGMSERRKRKERRGFLGLGPEQLG